MKWINNLTGRFLNDEIIQSEEVEIVKYGLESIGNNLLGLFSTLIIGICFGYLVDSFILWLLVFPLRKNAGGFHAETRAKCLLISIGMIILSFVFLIQIEWSRIVYILITIVSCGIILAFAPVENHNKPLDMIEYKVYRWRTRGILLLEGMLFIIANIFKWEILIRVIASVFFIVGIQLVAGSVKLRLENRYNNVRL